MDLRERTNDYIEAIRAGLDGRQSKIWTAMPGIILSYDPTEMVCSVQLAIQARWTRPEPKDKVHPTRTSLIDIPAINDCPVLFPSGGGYAMTFPIQPGDECLVVFASRGIDYWWQNGAWGDDNAAHPQAPAEARMHDINDGFVLPGPFSQPNVLDNVSPDTVELRSDAGEVVFGLNKAGVTVTGDNGNLSVAGNGSTGTGVTATFTTPTGQIVTVTNGLITNIN